MRDKIRNGYLEHEVKKMWNNIVSCGDYTIEKCRQKNVGLKLIYKDQCMTIPKVILEKRMFKLHNKIIHSKYGKPYRMVDFQWNPDEKEETNV